MLLRRRRRRARAAGPEPAASLATAEEEQALAEAGSLRRRMPPEAQRASTMSAVRLAALIEDALSDAQAAALMGVGIDRVRRQLDARTLFGIQSSGGWRLPRFQFGPDGQPIRGLEQVLPALPATLHPLAVLGFLTRAHADLAVNGTPRAPLDWLAGRRDPGAVVALTADLDRLP